jgi:hypothetical protein
MTGIGLRAAVVRRSEVTRFSSLSDDEVGGFQARSARSERQRAEQSNEDAQAYCLRHALQLVDQFSGQASRDISDHIT